MNSLRRAWLVAAAVVLAGSATLNANVIDGADERDSILKIGASLGLTSAEISRIRHLF